VSKDEPVTKRVEVIGTPCCVTNPAEFVETAKVIARRAAGASCVDFTNVHIVAQRRIDAEFRRATDTMDFFVPDSQVLVWAVRLLGGRASQRAYGPDFMPLCIRGTPAPFSHYFLGGSEECLERLLANVRRLQPDVFIAGAHHGFFSDADDARIVEEINRISPDFIWVGMGTPRQQVWIHRHRSAIRRGVLMAVGFAFDVNAGTKKDAPAWLGRLGLTWFYRILREPRRLFWRYAKFNTIFLWFLAWQYLGRLFGKGKPPK
jgi:N-acetylglucosaminyldiphosphoundecaprenol N-acetyl-beta-D-mannosaminyltransferase